MKTVFVFCFVLLTACSSGKNQNSGGRNINSYTEEQYQETEGQTRQQFPNPGQPQTEQAQPF